MDLKNKIVVVTGSTRGFGLSISKSLLKAGAIVIISGRSQLALDRAIADLSKIGSVDGKLCDVRDEKDVYALARYVIDKCDHIDIWINNAGYSAAAGMMMDLDPAHALDMFRANDMGTVYGTQAALHFMLPRKEGMLVNMYGAGSFLSPSSPTGLYAATKAWITSFTRTLAVEIKGSGVKLLGFSPGMMLTDMLLHPTVVGERGKEGMKNFGFVLRFLAVTPEVASQELVKTIQTQHKEFVEVRSLNGFKIMLNLLRVKFEDWTGKGKTPEFTLHHQDAYKPEI